MSATKPGETCFVVSCSLPNEANDEVQILPNNFFYSVEQGPGTLY